MVKQIVERDRKARVMPVKLSPSLLSDRDKGSVTRVIQEVNSKQEKKMSAALNQIVSLINAAGSKGKGNPLLFQVRDIAVGALMGE